MRNRRLKNGNPPGDLSKVPLCGARTRKGSRCQGPAMANGRCRMHGGLSTDPRTLEGLERSRKANWKHGRYFREAIQQRRDLIARRQMLNAWGKEMKKRWRPYLRELARRRSQERYLRQIVLLGELAPSRPRQRQDIPQ